MDERPRLTVAQTVAACLGIAALTLGVVAAIYATEPEARQEGATRRTAMLVELATAERGTFRPRLEALGTVRPSQDVALSPRVAGQVQALSEDFVPGRTVAEGEPLVFLDPADARNRLAQQQSALRQARSELALERGRQAVAKIEREQIEGDISADQEALILRQPQLEAARARVEAARASVRQASLELERTTVTAPFDALVLDRTAHVGSLVTPSATLGRVVAVRSFWVELTLPARRLAHLAVPAPGERGPEVRLRDRASFAPEEHRVGRLDSVIRQVDDQTRLARLLVTVDDPLALEPSTEGPPLLAGAFVHATLPGVELPDVLRLPRELLRQDRTVWVMEEDVLRIRTVEVVLEDAEYAYIGAGLADDAQIVATDLATVVDGAPLRVATP